MATGIRAQRCSDRAENSANEGPYMAMRLNEQRFETTTGGYEHEEIIMPMLFLRYSLGGR